MSEVIDLSDDDDICEVAPPPPSSKIKIFKCLNPECRKTGNLYKAPISVRRYYGLLSNPKKTKVCLECYEVARNRKQSFIDLIKAGQNIMKIDVNIKNNTMILTDSDSDKTDDDDTDGDSEFEYDLEEISEGSSNVIGDSNNSGKNLQFILADVMSKMNLNRQILDGKDIINKKLLKADSEFEKLNKEFNQIEKSLDKMRNKFYETFTIDTKWLPPLEIGPPDLSNESSDVTEVIPVISQSSRLFKKLPPFGLLSRPLFTIGETVYATRYSEFSQRITATVISVEKKIGHEPYYKIEYTKGKDRTKVLLSGKSLAYLEECPTRIPVGTRIIARFEDEDDPPESRNEVKEPMFFVGIIAEVPTGVNKFRYLIFFDDGYAQYVEHEDIRVVSYSCSNTWEDVAAVSKEFVRDYLQTYPERPMVRLQKTDYIKTELQGRWWRAEVLEVDCSLAKMFFPVDKRTEWIYRGSTRLSPLFDKKVNMRCQTVQHSKIIRRRTLPVNRSAPVLEYINFNKEEDQNDSKHEETKPIEKRAVARKSTAKSNTGIVSVGFRDMKEKLALESKGDYTFLKIRELHPKFTPHQCGPRCLNEKIELLKDRPPLFKPILSHWRRQICKQRKKTITRKFVYYVAPCGRRLRSLEDIFRYLRITQSKMSIDFFTDDSEIILEREWEPCRKLLNIIDITDGKEDVSISCVNSIDNNKPKTLIYCNVRQPSRNVGLNLDPEFLVCCSCEDDCQDKSLCECWQMTIEASKLFGGKENPDAGYKFRRLNQQVSTGVYECNSNCRCKNSCLNRIVQFPIRQKLQLFKTARRGWGVRTLNDIPKGTFICVYVGKVLSEAEANEDGMTDGADDYYAELDFIEVIEGMKEGYEENVEDIEEEENMSNQEYLNSADLGKRSLVKASDYKPNFGTLSKFSIERGKSSRLLARQLSKEDTDDYRNSERRPQTFDPTPTPGGTIISQIEHKSVRSHFGCDEHVFIMDAKVTGNIGRYLNHSCSPNVFVQNVFVDTHDPRFPWIAFFSGANIKAGAELTWDYNYEVDSVPGKIKYCYCQSSNCRGRLL